MPALTRDQFREAAFARDNHLCVICRADAQDVHHILERRLFDDGGYHLSNGASLCGSHHIDAEKTILGCEKIREAAGIEEIILPEHLYPDQIYDKWGNPILPNGQRLRGELFDDPSVQKILQEVLHLFTHKVKYPRTFHCCWSPGVGKKDRVHKSMDQFRGQDVVVTAKLDGENTTWYSDYMHARSLEYDSHLSRDWVKALHARTAYDLPERWRLCGENLYAKHTIHYQNLPAYFLVFSIWNDTNQCLSWDETLEWISILGLHPVPTLYRGPYDEDLIRRLWTSTLNGDEAEGYVIRAARAFHYKDFRKLVAKYVRAGHVQEHGGHWLRQLVIPNRVRPQDGTPPTSN